MFKDMVSYLPDEYKLNMRYIKSNKQNQINHLIYPRDLILFKKDYIQNYIQNTDEYLYLKNVVDKVDQLLKFCGPSACLAGGWARSLLNDEPIKDFDIFFENEEIYQVTCEWCRQQNMKEYDKNINSHNFYIRGITYKNMKEIPISLIHRKFYPGLNNLLSDFDLTLTCNFFGYSNNTDAELLILFPHHIKAKKIQLNSSYVFNTSKILASKSVLVRTFKFLHMGYTLSDVYNHNTLVDILSYIESGNDKENQIHIES